MSATAAGAGLTSIAGALKAENLVQPIDDAKNITVFAPSNTAFKAIGSALGNLTTQQLTNILGYHVLNGTVAYSTDLKNNTQYTASNGQNITVRIENGSVFVDSAKVITPNVLVANGVVHVIDKYVIRNSLIYLSYADLCPVSLIPTTPLPCQTQVPRLKSQHSRAPHLPVLYRSPAGSLHPLQYLVLALALAPRLLVLHLAPLLPCPCAQVELELLLFLAPVQHYSMLTTSRRPSQPETLGSISNMINGGGGFRASCCVYDEYFRPITYTVYNSCQSIVTVYTL